jgi:hypothetical protein
MLYASPTPYNTFKVPIWGINTIVIKDGSYYLDTDFNFGIDLVMEYDFTMKYLDPFTKIYKKYSSHKGFKRVYLGGTTTWVRSYISPVFVMVPISIKNISIFFKALW